ncbi:MAG TPA: hypothetical protein GX736_02330 [Mogibacterium sp.]|nr:hypothetical protein [Mogibacterium sp.]
MKKIKTRNKNILCILLSTISGYILTLEVFSEVIPVYIGTTGFVYPLVLYMTLFATIILFYIIFQILFNKHLSKSMVICLFIMYFILLTAILFFRHTFERYLIINPFVGVLDVISDSEMLKQSLLNIIIFVPMGYLFRNKKMKETFITALLLSLGIETIQYFFKLGFFDTFDCILYILGILLGRYIFKKIDIEKLLRFDNEEPEDSGSSYK